jgi:hypothetical protein
MLTTAAKTTQARNNLVMSSPQNYRSVCLRTQASALAPCLADDRAISIKRMMDAD